MSDKLKPCPFCGGEAILRMQNADYIPDMYAVECHSCKYITDFYTNSGKAIEAWNRRAEVKANG